MSSSTVVVDDAVSQDQHQGSTQHTFGTANCAYCTREFTKVAPTQIFCKDPACKLAARPDLMPRRANYPMIKCALAGCTAEPFQKMRPDHQFCSTIHRVLWHNQRKYMLREAELDLLRKENEQLREQLAALTSTAQQKKRKKA